MKDKFEDLNDTFDITPVESEVVKEPKKPDKVSKSKEIDIDKDYEYTRGNLYSIIEKGQEALDVMMRLQHKKKSQNPKNFHVQKIIIFLLF